MSESGTHQANGKPASQLHEFLFALQAMRRVISKVVTSPKVLKTGVHADLSLHRFTLDFRLCVSRIKSRPEKYLFTCHLLKKDRNVRNELKDAGRGGRPDRKAVRQGV